jgi:hypothetical protein
MMDKKGQVMQQLGALGVGIATLAIVLTVAFLIQGNVQEQIVDQAGLGPLGAHNGTIAYNASVTLQAATADVPGWVPLVVIVAIGGIILGMISVFKK